LTGVVFYKEGKKKEKKGRGRLKEDKQAQAL
jgi:hypothetical protein